MKCLVENPSNGCRLCYAPERVNRYMVYKKVPTSQSGDIKLDTMIAQSSSFTPKIKSYFTNQQVQTAIAKVRAMKYVSKRFKG